MNKHTESPLFAEERQEEILRLLKEKSKLTVSELCSHFALSAATIRNDIRKLAAQGRLKRTHGGIIPVEKVTFEPTSEYKQNLNMKKKIRIARKAAELIKDGDTIILDAGTTTMELAKQLVEKKNLTVIVNDISIALFLEKHSAVKVILLSGILRRGFHNTVGPWTTSVLEQLNVDTAFLSANSFSLTKGFMTPDIQQAEVKKAYIKSASHTVILLDSSKIGSFSFIIFAEPENIETIITDTEIDESSRTLLNGHIPKINIYYA